jgi:hypothetical protein
MRMTCQLAKNATRISCACSYSLRIAHHPRAPKQCTGPLNICACLFSKSAAHALCVADMISSLPREHCAVSQCRFSVHAQIIATIDFFRLPMCVALRAGARWC